MSKITIGHKFFAKIAFIHELMTHFDYSQEKQNRLGRTEYTLLNYLMKKNKAINMKELADFLNVSYSRITHLIDTCLKKGYVTRINSNDDRRVNYAQITETGINVTNQFKDGVIAKINVVLTNLPDEEQSLLIEALENWKKVLITQ